MKNKKHHFLLTVVFSIHSVFAAEANTISLEDYKFIDIFGCDFPIPKTFVLRVDSFYSNGDLLFHNMTLDVPVGASGQLIVTKKEIDDVVPSDWVFGEDVFSDGLRIVSLEYQGKIDAFKKIEYVIATDGNILMEFITSKNSSLVFDDMVQYCLKNKH